jgi:hypothetical protein
MRDNIIEQVKETVRNSTDLTRTNGHGPCSIIGGAVYRRAIDYGHRHLAARLISRSVVRRQRPNRKLALAENSLDHYANQLGQLKKAEMASLVPLASEFVRTLVPAIVAQLDKYARAKNHDIVYPESVDRVRQEGERASDTIRSSVH